ncbi:MAG: MFS transporter [Endomicrobiales bacterium]|nr:MFS transporter [Endomicrobiales bacterium]
MSETKKVHITRPEDIVPLPQKIIYGLGMFVNNLVPAAMGCMAVVLNLGLKMNPALIGYILSLPRIIDAFTDPVLGYVSDNTRSRFGRRKPYIFFGAITLGITFALMWRIGYGHSETFYFLFFLAGVNILFLFNTIFATPFVALGYEMTPDYHERTGVMAWANWLGQIPWLLTPWFWWIMANKKFFDTPVAGAQAIALWVGVTVIVLGVMPGIFCRERYKHIADTELLKKVAKGVTATVTNFFQGFAVTLKNTSFLKICGATFFLFNGYMIIAGLALYVFIYFTFGGSEVMGGKYNGLFGTTTALSTIFIVIPFVTFLAKKIGKKGAFITSTSISLTGFLIKWWCFNPAYSSLSAVNLPFLGEVQLLILLPAVFISFGVGSVFTLMGSMMADICDLDELNNGKRREGMFGAIYWWMVKLGMSLAFAISGNVLNATGFDVAFGAGQSAETLLKLRLYDIGIPILTSLLAIAAIVFYDINEEKAGEIRAELEKRRGKTDA